MEEAAWCAATKTMDPPWQRWWSTPACDDNNHATLMGNSAYWDLCRVVHPINYRIMCWICWVVLLNLCWWSCWGCWATMKIQFCCCCTMYNGIIFPLLLFFHPHVYIEIWLCCTSVQRNCISMRRVISTKCETHPMWVVPITFVVVSIVVP